MMRDAAMSSMARVIFFIDCVDLIFARYSRRETATSAPLLLDDLLLLDVLVLERLELLVAGLDALAGARLEALEELLVGVVERVLVVVLELPGLTDRVEDALVLELDVLEELLLEPADVDDGHGVELAGGG